MKWFVLVLMLGMNPDGSVDTYIFTDPHKSLEECQTYVYNNSSSLKNKLMIEFEGKPIDRVFCIEEDKLKKYFELVTEQGTQT